MKLRCGWADGDPMYEKYHDEEWAVPLYDDTLLFEFLFDPENTVCTGLAR